MAAYLSRAANVVLFSLCCWIAAGTADAVVAALWLQPVPISDGEGLAETGAGSRSWGDRQIILVRNLFNASTLLPAEVTEIEPEVEEEELAETQLPLRLLGTAAAQNPTLARAAIEDTETRARLVVSVGDRVKDQATVLRIERRRVVLAENDARRVLTLDDDFAAMATALTSRKEQRREQAVKRRAKRAAKNVKQPLRNPAQLLQQARFLPKYENGEMAGLQVNSIKAGSLIEEVGLENGDVITTANGILIDSPQASAEVFQEFGEADEIDLEISRADGSTVPITISTQ